MTKRMGRVASVVALSSLAGMLISVPSLAAASMLKPGEKFPVWELPDHTGATVSSASLSGKTYLIWFYPKAMTPGCTAEGRGLRDRHGQLQERGVTVLGVSFDEPAANAEFVKQEQFPFRLLSDRQRKLAIAVGAADSVEQPVARRISYLVGPDGVVLKAYDAVNPQTHASDVIGDVKPLP